VRSRSLLASLIIFGSSAAFFVACGDATFADGKDASSDGDVSDGAIDSGAEAEGGADAGVCASKAGPSMVEIPTAGPPYCIDSTEVTRGQYAAFVQAIADRTYVPDAGDPRCAWKSGFAIDTTCSSNEIGDAGAADAGELPVTCIDWCDAFSFCDFAGKRLCGMIGSTKELDPVARSIDPDVSQWENACTANQTRIYPYGNAFEPNACNVVGTTDGGTAFGSGLALPGAYSQCSGGYPGIYDLAGNAGEWVDACNEVDGGAAETFCVRIGGSFMSGDQLPAGTCKEFASNARINIARDVGFRCCSK
jgi:formylglycine-generating enzyme required for sulfatase activity